MILQYSILIFLTQVVFIGCRTWNVKAIAKNNLLQVLISGGLVHIAWLISIAIGSVSTMNIIENFEWKYLPILLCSLVGGLFGSYLGLKERTKK